MPVERPPYFVYKNKPKADTRRVLIEKNTSYGKRPIQLTPEEEMERTMKEYEEWEAVRRELHEN